MHARDPHLWVDALHGLHPLQALAGGRGVVYSARPLLLSRPPCRPATDAVTEVDAADRSEDPPRSRAPVRPDDDGATLN
jgi:hypothetical protein